MAYPCGERYQGQWREDCKQGTGTFLWASVGHVYQGQWHSDQVCFFSCLYNHIGVTLNSISFLLTEGQRNGWGVYRFESEEVRSEIEFEGSWKDDRPSPYPSQGTLRNINFTYTGNITAQPMQTPKECPHLPYIIFQASIAVMISSPFLLLLTQQLTLPLSARNWRR